MKPAFRAEAEIPHAADVVWNTLTHWEHAPQWMKGVDALEVEGPAEVGATVTFVARGRKRGAEIVAFDPGRELTLRSVQGGVTADYRYTIEPLGEHRCRAALVAQCHSRGLLWRTLAPLIRFAMKHTDGGQIVALSDLVDAEVERGSASGRSERGRSGDA